MYFFVGATPRGSDPAVAPSNHSPDFFLDEEALRIGTRALLATATEYLGAE
jgi:amidohydrolase